MNTVAIDTPEVMPTAPAVFRALRKMYLYRIMRDRDGSLPQDAQHYIDHEDWQA